MSENITSTHRSASKRKTASPRTVVAAVLWLLLMIANFVALQRINVESIFVADIIKDSSSVMDDATAAITLPPVHIGSAWIGNHWIPPKGYRLYSPKEMLDYFSQYKILFLGDSTARRAYATLYGIMNSTDLNNVRVPQIAAKSVIDVNKRTRVENCTKTERLLCRYMPPSASNNNTQGNPIDMMSSACKKEMTKKLNFTESYDLVVINIGAWELLNGCPNDISQEELFQNLIALQRDNLTIVWRSVPPLQWEENVANSAELGQKWRNMTEQYEQKLLQEKGTMSSLTMVDWGSAMAPRSWPEEDRVKGDIPAHFGWEARVVLLQMLMNHLIQRDKLRQQLIK